MRKTYCDLCGRELKHAAPKQYFTGLGAECEICYSCDSDFNDLKSLFASWKREASANRPEDFVSERVIGNRIVGDFYGKDVQLLVSEEKE